MADKLISSLTAATTLTVADMIVTEIATSGNSRKVTAGVAGVAVGTAFGTPATSDRLFRTDRGIEYYYDGTRWLSTQLIVVSLSGGGDNLGPYAATTGGIRRAPVPYSGTYSFYAERFETSTHLASANNATNYMTIALDTKDGASTTNQATVSTQNDANAAFVAHNTAMNVVLTNVEAFEVGITETGTVTGFYFTGNVIGRLIG